MVAVSGIEGVDLKLGRAKQCLALLEYERAALLERQENRTIGQYHPDIGEFVVRVDGDLPDLRWGITAGEFAHALRSALDNLLWALVVRRGGTPTTIHQFPIYENRTKFEGKPRTKSPKWATEGERLTHGVLPKDFAFIEERQPFQLGPDLPNLPVVQWHPLAMLGYLNNVDKHRFIHVSFSAASVRHAPEGQHVVKFSDSTVIVSEDGDPGPLVPRFLFGGRLDPSTMVDGFPCLRWSRDGMIITILGPPGSDDPAEIARVVDAPNPEAEMYVYDAPAIDISFSDRKRPMSVFDLADVLEEVVGIVEHFRPAFA